MEEKRSDCVQRLSAVVQQQGCCSNPGSKAENQKMIQFYHNKRIDMLKLGCTLPNLKNNFLHKSIIRKFCPICDRDLCCKTRRKKPLYLPLNSIEKLCVIKHSSVCLKTKLIDCWNWCTQGFPIPNVSKYANRTIHEIKKLTPICRSLILDINNLATLMSFYLERGPECIIESFSHLKNRKKIDWFDVDGCFCDHCRVATTISAPVKMLEPS